MALYTEGQAVVWAEHESEPDVFGIVVAELSAGSWELYIGPLPEPEGGASAELYVVAYDNELISKALSDELNGVTK